MTGGKAKSDTAKSGRKGFSVTLGVTIVLSTLLIISAGSAAIYGFKTHDYSLLKGIAETGEKLLVQVAVAKQKA
jgi:hypothetical protein